MNRLSAIYPVCSRLLPPSPPIPDIEIPRLADYLEAHPSYLESRPWIADLARIEAARHSLLASADPFPDPDTIHERALNPHLHLIPVRWRGLDTLLREPDIEPTPGEGFVLVWRTPDNGELLTREAHPSELLALKLVSEQIDSRSAAAEGGVPVGTIDDSLSLAEQEGLLIAPSSRIVRPPEFPRGEVTESRFFTTPTFTLQWHITQTCDLHCRHCYDRSEREELPQERCIAVLDELYDFCREHHVFTQVTFTGGNPLLYPHFNELYREAVDRGFLTAILGNPMPRHRIEEMIAIRKPEFYQVSLEGLREHNDHIRGPGHFDRVFAFLDLLRELDIYSMVMLTLTRANLDQVLDLAEMLRDRVDLFTFNRLAMVGEGAELASVEQDAFQGFLRSYLDAAAGNPCMGLKDNLFNILKYRSGQPFFGGCAGRGCGAAFNFAALLPDGEVHACRKFPSPIGNLHTGRFRDIYHGEAARRYRAGSRACANCPIRPVCGGCMAVAYGFGRDIFNDLDPYCFFS
ncbi:MAG: thio(seleno)oxazole modification radical SAM maturase SbtM [Desulfobulbaceae bacterium]